LASRTAKRRVAGASATVLLNESLKKRHVTNLAQQCDARRQVVGVDSCALSDVNAYGCQSAEQGEFISPAKTERKRIRPTQKCNEKSRN
jgi:hypothetical protein